MHGQKNIRPLDIVCLYPPTFRFGNGVLYFQDENGRNLKLAFYTVQLGSQARMWLCALNHNPRCLAQRYTALTRSLN